MYSISSSLSASAELLFVSTTIRTIAAITTTAAMIDMMMILFLREFFFLLSKALSVACVVSAGATVSAVLSVCALSGAELVNLGSDMITSVILSLRQRAAAKRLEP